MGCRRPRPAACPASVQRPAAPAAAWPDGRRERQVRRGTMPLPRPPVRPQADGVCPAGSGAEGFRSGAASAVPPPLSPGRERRGRKPGRERGVWQGPCHGPAPYRGQAGARELRGGGHYACGARSWHRGCTLRAADEGKMLRRQERQGYLGMSPTCRSSAV